MTSDEYFQDWNNLVHAVNSAAGQILKDNVAPIAERILSKHIKSDIYY